MNRLRLIVTGCRGQYLKLREWTYQDKENVHIM